jgi:hypothetical protein
VAAVWANCMPKPEEQPVMSQVREYGAMLRMSTVITNSCNDAGA